jgi:hypothetical protein
VYILDGYWLKNTLLTLIAVECLTTRRTVPQ